MNEERIDKFIESYFKDKTAEIKGKAYKELRKIILLEKRETIDRISERIKSESEWF